MEILQNSNVVVGQRQILRELKRGNVAKIQIARDAQASYVHLLATEAKAHNVTVVFDGTMAQIAKRYGVDCASGAVGFLKVGNN